MSEYETVTQTAEVRKYKPFEGQNIVQMQRLITGIDQETGEPVDVPRILLTAYKLLNLRVEGMPGDREYLRSRYVHVDVSLTLEPQGDEIKFTIDDPQIKTLTADTKLEEGVLPTTQEHYESQDGFILTGSEVQEFRNNPYALPKKRREFWEFLAEGDTALAKKYEKDVTKSLGLSYDNIMGIWLPDIKGKRLLCRRCS